MSVSNKTLKKGLIFVIILIGVLFVFNIILASTISTIRDFGYKSLSEVHENCKEHLDGEKVKDDFKFGLCITKYPKAGEEIEALKEAPEEGGVARMIIYTVRWVMGIIGALAVAAIVWGGITYITSAGNEKQIEQAKRILLYAIIGFVVTVLAQVILWAATKAIEAGI